MRGFDVTSKWDPEQLGLEVYLQRPSDEDAQRIPTERGQSGAVIYPELDGDGDHLHFEMVPMSGESLLLLTISRGTTPALAANSLRKVASLIDRHGDRLLRLHQGNQGSFGNRGELIDGPLRLEYDEHGDIVIPGTKSLKVGAVQSRRKESDDAKVGRGHPSLSVQHI
jgi:hypothetical protein